MATTTCGFSSGFSSGFDVCDEEAVAREPARGVPNLIPLPPRQKLRRLAKVRIGGSALQFTITTGKIRLQRRVAGRIIQPVETSGRLRSYQRLGGILLQEIVTAGRVAVALVISGDVEALPSLAEGRVGVHPPGPQTIAISGVPILCGVVTVGKIGHARAVAGSARGVASVAAGAVRCALAVFGEAFAQRSEAVGSLAVACVVGGEVTAQTGIAIGSVETDDEAASLMALGLPSDVLV